MKTIEDLFRAHAADVLAYAQRRTDRASAEDVVSEVFLVAGRRLDRVPADEPQLWLYAVARRVLANDRRGARRRLALMSALADGLRDAPVEARQAGGPLIEALAALRPRDREILMLAAWEGLDAKQIAVVFGCSSQAVHTRLHRARRRLRGEVDARSAIAVSIAHPEVSP